MGIDESKIGELFESFKKAKVKEKKPKIREKEKTWKVLTKYFVHGTLFSLLYLVLAIVWVFILTILVIVGLFIGLIIGFVILMFIIGYLNSFLTHALWFPVKTPWKSVLGHGFVLFILLLIVNAILIVVPNMLLPVIATRVITFLIGAFADGYVAKNVASWWKQEYEEGIPKAVEAEWRNRRL